VGEINHTKFQSMNKLDQIKFETKLLLKILRNRYIRNQKRTRTKGTVQKDYDQNAWKNIFLSKYWEKAKNLEEFCFSVIPTSGLNADTKITCLIDGKLTRITTQSYQNYVSKKHYEIMKNFLDENDEIIELGCGFGYRLFSLRMQGLKNQMRGYDVSTYGTKTAEEINNFFSCDIKFGKFDMTEDFDTSILTGKTVFTYHSLEQLKYYTQKVISNLIKSKPRQVLHFEPVPELLGFNLLDIVSKQHNSYADYQNNLLSTLKNFEKNHLVNITDVKRLRYVNPVNETTLIRWIPKQN